MKFALVDGQKVEASKGAKGSCIFCQSPVIAKCGEIKINHWAHLKISSCDSWKEKETEWHRLWKNAFPVEWQEIIQYDDITNEKHIADIRTEQCGVIEFQHSQIDPVERRKREEFYKDLVWVVDGTRLKKDYPRFLSSLRSFEKVRGNTFKIDTKIECFPQTWMESSVPVVFDFLNHQSITGNDWRIPLYCLLPVKLGNFAIVQFISQQSFVNAIKDGNWANWVKSLIAGINQVNKEFETIQAAKSQVN